MDTQTQTSTLPPDAPLPPPELVGPTAENPAPIPQGAAGPTPEQIDAAAQTYARFTGQIVDMLLLTRRGYTPMTPAERSGWVENWREECKARPFLVGKVPPELALVAFLWGLVETRKEYERKEVEGNAP